jgi:LysM repeat protein
MLHCRFILLAFAACGSLAAQKMSTQQYIEEFKYAAMQEMKIYGIPASVTLAQGILESASGNSQLAKDCNNHFGIKCRKNWTGNFCLADDDAADECFRGYPNAMESYRDHSLFLKGASRYDFLFSLPVTDYRAWAHGLRQAGYATNPAYGNIIIGVVERYRLSMYDSMMVLGADYASPDTAAGRLIQMHGLPAVIVSKSQNPEDIAKLYDMGVWQIYKYNDLKKGEELKPGEIIYLKPKKRKADENFHLVKEGETLRDVSQQHGVKLKHLEKFNHIMSSQPLKPGEVIYLREKRRKDSADVAEADKKTELSTTADTGRRVAQAHGNSQLLANPAGNVNAESDKFQNTVSNNPAGNSLVYHTVLPGETVYSISRLYNLSADSLMKWNRISDAKIRIGQELRINSAPKHLQHKSNQTHTVSAGETLYQISRRYAVSVSDLQAQNNLKGPEIKAGQVLQIP